MIAPVRLSGSRLAALLPGALLLGMAPVAPALAYWQLTPQVEGGITFESNPRYITKESEDILKALNPGIMDNVLGVYLDARLEGAYKTPNTELSLVPRIRQTNYLKSNEDLNDDDWYVDLAASNSGVLGNLGLLAHFEETGVRTSEFDSAIPDNPDDPPPVTGGSGRFSGDTQQTWSVQPSLAYQLSERNQVSITGQYAETTYDQQQETLIASRSYLDYNYSSLDLSLRHVLNAKNYFAMTLTAGNFLAQEPGRPFENSTDSFGITGAYSRTFSETLTGTATVGVTRSSVDVSGIVGGFDPLTGALCRLTDPCSTKNEERNFVGSIEVRKRSEFTTMNFSVSSQIAPRSDGTEVVQEQARLYVERVLTQKLTANLGLLYTTESAVGQIFQPDTATLLLARQDRNYFTIEPGISYRLTETLSVYGRYGYSSNENDVTTGKEQSTNNRLFFGVLYRGVGLRR